jgi:hypothetical protein
MRRELNNRGNKKDRKDTESVTKLSAKPTPSFPTRTRNGRRKERERWEEREKRSKKEKGKKKEEG